MSATMQDFRHDDATDFGEAERESYRWHYGYVAIDEICGGCGCNEHDAHADRCPVMAEWRQEKAEMQADLRDDR